MVENKIRFFYDSIKIVNSVSDKRVIIPMTVAIPVAAALSLAVSAAVIIPTIVKKNAVKSVSKA
ncbi:MAG: hypothetical protein MJ101_03965 [Clostridia bacterium]|nr:hypothetical protein [Clostridia bacterium]